MPAVPVRTVPSSPVSSRAATTVPSWRLKEMDPVVDINAAGFGRVSELVQDSLTVLMHFAGEAGASVALRWGSA
jgi:hypothetical protein